MSTKREVMSYEKTITKYHKVHVISDLRNNLMGN